MIQNNSFLVEVLEKEKRAQIQKDTEKAGHIRQLPKGETKRVFSLDKLYQFRTRISLAIKLQRFSFR